MLGQEEDEWTWLIATVRRAAEGRWEVTGTRPLSAREAEDLEAKGRFITEVANQREFRRVVDAVQRWLETLRNVERHLRDRGSVPAALRTAAALDLIALARAVDLCEAALLDAVRRGAALDPRYTAGVRQLDEMRQSVRARQVYLLLPGLASQARERNLDFVLIDGEVRIAGVTSHSADELGQALMVELARLVFVYVDVFSQALEDAASELEALTVGLPSDAYPDMVRLASNAGQKRLSPTFANLPITEAIALRRFRAQAAALNTPALLSQAVFALMSSGTHHRFQVGGVDISGAAVTGTATGTVDALPTAMISVDLDLVGSAPIDYWAPVTIDVVRGNQEHRLFGGAVQAASVELHISLECEGAVELSEHNLAGVVAANVDRGELIRSLMRQAGVADDALVISEDEATHPDEVFEVFIPIRGIAVQEPVTIGPMTMVPLSTCEPILSAFDFGQELGAELEAAFRDASAYGLARVQASTLDVAEDLGYREIQTTMAWLIATERNGFLRLPDGTARAFSRQHALNTPSTGSVILVHGSETGRQWLRWPLGSVDPLTRSLDSDTGLLNPSLPGYLDPPEQRSLLALKRAVAEISAESQLQAIWEALESYAAGVKGPRLFTKEERRKLQDTTPTWMTPEQRDKFTTAVADLNRPPLGVRLQWRLDQDAVPLAAHERALIFGTLRTARNDVAHGRTIEDPPRRADMLLAISVVARIVLFGIAARCERDALAASSTASTKTHVDSD